MVFPNDVVVLPDPAVASDLVDGPTFQDKLVAQLGPYKPVVEALQAHGLTLPTRTLAKTGAYTMVPGDGTVLADATAGAFNVTLPAHLAGRMVRVVKVDASANAVTVLPGSGLLAGGASDVLGAQWLGATYQSDGTNWVIVARAVPRGVYVEPAPAQAKIVYVSEFGDDAATGQHHGAGPKGAVRTLARALQIIGTTARGVIDMGIGVIDAGAGCSFAGYRCVPKGHGPGTVVRATLPQRGPVLDFNRWLHPGFEYVQEMGNFTVEGDNTPAPVLANITNKQMTANVITLTTSVPHGLAVGDAVWVRGVPGTGFVSFNGVQTLTAVTATTLSFAYRFSSGDVASTAVASGTVARSKAGVVITAAAGVALSSVTTRYTGGPGFDFTDTQCSRFDNLTVTNPVDAAANDVPYFYGEGACNGNFFTNLGVRSLLSTADVGVSGAFAFVDSGVFEPNFNEFHVWVEFLHLPTGACLFQLQGNSNQLDMKTFDSSIVAGATGTTAIRLAPPTSNDQGGNEITGMVLGTQTDSFHSGVELRQSRNRVVGVKGHIGTNVVLYPGVIGCYVSLEGINGGAGAAGIIDNSATYDNELHDAQLRYRQVGRIRTTIGTDGTIEVRDMSLAGTPLVTRSAASEYRVYMPGVAGNPIALAIFEREMKLSNVAWARMGATADNGLPWMGYNLTYSAANSRFQHAVDGPSSGFVFENTGTVSFYVNPSQVAGSVPAKKVVIGSTGTVAIRAGETNVPAVTLFNTSYGLGMDAGDTVLFSGLGFNFKNGSVTGTSFMRLLSTGLTVSVPIAIADAQNIGLGTVTGSKLGATSAQKLGFWGVARVVQPSAYTQTYSTADKTHAARLAAAVAATAATQTTPYGYSTQAQADSIVTQLNNLRTDQLDTAQALNALIDDLQAMGLVA